MTGPAHAAALPVKFKVTEKIIDDCRNVSPETMKQIAASGHFESGQISGPYGPQFVGYGPTPKPSLRSAFVMAAAIAGLSGAVMLASWAL